jgi:two-component sensor histidine kinase
MTSDSTVQTSWRERLISIGVVSTNPDEFNNKLRLTNVFIWLCVLYCVPYYVWFFSIGNYNLGSIFVINQLFFCLSLVANQRLYYNTARILIIISSNYVVLLLNFAFGHESAFLLYYFATPLVVYTLFHYRQRLQIILGLSLYMSSYVIGEVFHFMGTEALLELEQRDLTRLHFFNVFAAFGFLIFLALGFSKQFYNAFKELNRRNEQQQKLIAEKNTLLSETHHRVKNNLAVISGMLDLQMIYDQNPKLSEILNNSKRRIKSMSLIHESLYREKDLAQIDFRDYITQMIQEIERSVKTNPNIVVETRMQQLHFDLQRAVPLGLIMNEVLTNAFKHAFQPDQSGLILVEFVKEHSTKYVLRISDNGVGLPEETSSESLGMTLIDALVEQLDGTYSYKRINGTVFEMTFGNE